MRAPVCPVCSSLLLAAAGLAAAQERPTDRPERDLPAALRGDRRLERRVTVVGRRLYLGEVLDRLAAATGARIQADDRPGPLSGYLLAVRAEGRPAREVMEAVRRLYHQPPDRWSWERRESRDGSGSTGEPVYVLRSSLPPGWALAERRAFCERYMLAERDRLARFYALPAAERGRLAAGDAYLRDYNSARMAGFVSFVAPLSDPQLLAVIRGQRLDIPTGQLTAGQKAFVRSEFALHNSLGNNPGDPESLSHVTLLAMGQQEVVGLRIGSTGYGVLGGPRMRPALDARAAQRRRAWLAPGERTLDGPPPAPFYLYDRAVTPALRQHGAPGVPQLLARLPNTQVAAKRWTPYALARPRDDELSDRREAVPWPLVRDLRRRAESARGVLRPQDWLRLARLDGEQLETLEEEFPDAGELRRRIVRDTVRLWDGLSEREQAAAARPEGVTWAGLSPASRRHVLEQAPDPSAARRVRLHLQWREDTLPPKLQYRLTYTGKQKPPLAAGFRPARVWDDAQDRFVERRGS